MELIWFLIGLIVLVVIIGFIWQAFNLSLTLAPLNATQRTLIAILLLLLAAAFVWYFFGHLVPLPR